MSGSTNIHERHFFKIIQKATKNRGTIFALGILLYHRWGDSLLMGNLCSHTEFPGGERLKFPTRGDSVTGRLYNDTG